MKKLILVGALALCGAINAQETRFGAKAGYSLSMLKAEYDNTTIESDGKSTFYAGVLVEHKLNDQFALQAEVLYSPLGGKYVESESVAGFGYTYEADTKLGTVQVPVMAKYYVTENIALGAGVNFGLILSADQDWSETIVSPEGTVTESGSEDIKDEVSSLNLAPFIGAEYNLENGLFFDARYNMGVSNLVKDPTDGESMKLSFFQVGLGFKF